MDCFFFVFFLRGCIYKQTQRKQITLPSKPREGNWSDRCEFSYWRVHIYNFHTRKLINQLNTDPGNNVL